MKQTILFFSAIATIGLILGSGARAQSVSEEQLLIEQARHTANRMLNDQYMPETRDLMKDAKAVLIVPRMIKAGFLLAGHGGSGVLLKKGQAGDWSYPAFYTIGAGSFGLQAGIQDAEVMFLFMTDRGVEALVSAPFNLGGAASMSMGPYGAGVAGATTTNFGADILVVSRSKGLFGGISLEGTVAYPRRERNRAYYGRDAGTREIVLQRMFANKKADPLRNSLKVK